MTKVVATVLALAAPLLAESPLVIPHIADGGGWRSSIVVVSTFALETTRLTIKFRADDGRKVAFPIQNYGTIDTLDVELPADSSLYLETTGTSPSVRVGWVEVDQLTGALPVRGFAVFRQSVPGRPDFEAVSTGMRAAAAVVFPFDNTNGLETGFALVNLSTAACTIAVSPIVDEFGRSLTTVPRLAANLLSSGHVSFVATDRLPELAGRRGFLKFYPSFGCGAGGFAMLGLRFNPTGPFTNLVPLSVTSPF